MPSQPACFHRLDEIFTALRSMTSTHLDRLTVQKLFRVRRRRAQQIMAGLDGLRVSNCRLGSRFCQGLSDPGSYPEHRRNRKGDSRLGHRPGRVQSDRCGDVHRLGVTRCDEEIRPPRWIHITREKGIAEKSSDATARN